MTRLTRWLSGPTSVRRTPRRTLRLEALEGREVPAVITVTSLADNLTSGDGFVTLREAIQAANTNASVDGSVAGDGDDTIVFDSGLTGTVTLTLGELALTDDYSTTTVDGGGVITVDGNNTSRVFNVGQDLQATLRGLTITGGNSGMANGGGVYNAGGLTLDHVTVTGNTGNYGGGVYNDNSVYAIASDISGNKATASGGGVYVENYGLMTVVGSTVSGNSANSNGGGIAIDNDSEVTITGSTVSGNTAVLNGGGVHVRSDAELSLIQSTISGNTASSDGGGGYNDGTLTLDRSTFSDNTADYYGGGVYNHSGTLTIGRSTFAGNTAINDDGGGVYSFLGTSTADRSTFTGNTAGGFGGGVSNYSGMLTLGNSLLVGNAASSGEDLYGSISNNNGGNLVGLGSFTLDQILEVDGGGNPLLADNGGPTQTVALVAGSPAIGIASKAGPGAAPDQRGYGFATVASMTDAGAFQSAATAPEAGSLLVTIAADTTNPFDGLTSLREAIGYANTLTGSRTVAFAQGVAKSNLVLTNGALVLSGTDGETTVDGGGVVTVDGDNAGGVFEIDSGVTAVLRGLTITGGNTSGGGGVYNQGTLTIDESLITGNYAINGGGIFNSFATLTITNSEITNNFANNGGGIHNLGTLSVIDSLIDGNESNSLGGGGIWSQDATLTLLRATVSDNTSTFGGGVYIQDGGTATVTDSTFSNNTANDPDFGAGGGVYITYNATATITGTTFTGNTATRHGGGVDNDGELTVTASTFTGNSAGTDGGGIHNSDDLTITASTFTGNSAGDDGGGVFTNDDLTVASSTFTSNSAGDNGGGLYNYDSDVTITDSTFSGNTAAYEGGGVHNDSDGELTILRSTFVGNSANDGGGVYNDYEMWVHESTFVGNSATNSGGGINNHDDMWITDSLVVGNTAPFGPDVADLDGDNGGNLIGLPNGVTLGQVVQVDGSGHPVLADNGGPTKTVALMHGSPAIGNGTGSGTVDQRGVTRSVPPDTGAFQTQPVSVSVTAPGGVATGSPIGATDATVTGLSGTLATFGDAALVYRYYAGTLTAGQIAAATPLAGAPTAAGAYTVVAQFTTAGYTNTFSAPVHFTITPAPVVPPTVPPVSPPTVPPPPSTATMTPVFVATAPNSGVTGTAIKVFDPATGENTRTVVPFAGFFGAVDTATGDLNGDGIAEVIVGAGAGGGPRVVVLDGATGAELASFFAFGSGFTGGVDVAVGDVNGDGVPDLVVAAGPGGGPHVKVFDGKSFAELFSFFAYAPTFLGGVNVAAGDVDGDGKADIVTGAGMGAGPHVKVFGGADLAELYSFFAFAPNFGGGVRVAAGDVNGDGFADVIAGAGVGGSPQVAVFDGKDGGSRGSFLAFDAGFRGGVNVGTTTGTDGRSDIVAAAGPGGGPHVAVFDGDTFAPLSSTYAFGNDLLGGVSVS